MRKRKLKSQLGCNGSLRKAHSNTWLDNSKALNVALGLLYCLVNKISITAAMTSTNSGEHTAADHYSMCREVCEVIMSNEILNRPGIEVEIDETNLSRRKYEKGRRTASQTIVLFGIHERATNPGFHVQVCDKSSAVLLSEITRFRVQL